VTYPVTSGRPPGIPNCPTCPYRAQGASAICITCATNSVPPLTGRRCPICAQQITGANCRNDICNLPADRRGFTSVAAISVDSTPLRETIRRYKYDGDGGWAYIFGRLILGWLNRNAVTARSYTHIFANPSHQGRKPYQHVERILSMAAIEDIHRRWPLYPNALVKPAETPRSAGQSRKAKMVSAQLHADTLILADPPDAPPPLQDGTILLVDDIFTTGSQLDAVGRRLLASGAIRVDGLVLARRGWNS
jgi:predicted amidophosphoribosyltransferase